MGLFSLIQVGFEMRRFSIVGGLNPTWYAAQLVWSIIASYSVYLRSNLLGKIFLLINVVIVIFLLILTQGRNSIMALSTSFFISIIISQLKNIDFKTLVFKRKKHIIIKYIKILVICFFIIGVLSLILMETGVYDNLDRILQTSELISGDRDVATAGRTTIWNNYQHLLLRNFIVGRGVRSSNILYEQLYNVRIPAHNNFITILVEYGSIGLMLIITFHLYSFKLAFGRYEFIFSVCWISLALLFIGLGNDVIYYKYWWTGIIIFILILNIERSNKANSINS
ncbi:O-antigen ligase family protein [Natronospora cellulosivora (SeqCode)]